MNKRILVIGATGLTGKAVANELYSKGFNVVVMSRDRQKARKVFSDDFEILEADVLKPETIRYAFHAIDAVFISLPEKSVPIAIPNITKYAKEFNVKQLVYVSGCTVRKENAWHPMIKAHFEGEEAIKNSGINFTILRLTMVMDMIPRYANNGKAFIIGKQVHPWSWIHSIDIARMAAKAFFNKEALNKNLTFFGKEKLTIAEAVDKYNEVLNPKAKKAKSTPVWLAKIIALFVGEKLKYAVSIFKYFENHPEEGDPKISYEILGEPSMSISNFIELEKQK